MIPENIQTVMDDIEMFGESSRAEYLIDFSDHFVDVPEHVAKRPFPEENHVKECESDAYVFFEPNDDGTLTYHFAVENPQGVSARAFSVLLKEAVDGKTAAEIDNIETAVIQGLFGRGISMGKGMGLTGILNMVKYFAREHAK